MALVKGARRHCTYAGHEGPTWLLNLYFQPIRRNADGGVTKIHSWCSACMLLDQRAREGVKNMSPERLEERREYWRFRYDGRAREAGVPRRNMKKREGVPVNTGKGEKLPVGPLADWLEEKKIVELPSVDKRVIHRLLSRQNLYVTLDLVDRVLVAADEPWMLHELYPES